MDREQLEHLVRTEIPFIIRMNDGHEYTVENEHCIVVADLAAAVVFMHADGKRRLAYLPMVTMSGIEPISAA